MEGTRVELTSILFPAEAADSVVLAESDPDCFGDLGLDQLVDAVLGTDDYDLRGVFRTPLTTLDAVRFRHDVLADLSIEAVSSTVRAFAAAMRGLREQLALAGRLHYLHQRQRVFLDAASAYVALVGALARGLLDQPLASAGMTAVRDHLDRYIASGAFTRLADDAERVTQALDDVRYEFHIDGNSITVVPYDGEADYSAEVSATFAKFKQGEVAGHRTRFADSIDMNHVEAGILALVAEVFPEPFALLDAFFREHDTFQSATLARFDRELQFYLQYTDFLKRVAGDRLPSCVPEVVAERVSDVVQGYDLMLAAKRAAETRPVVANDFRLEDGEQFLVITGANQGGKTTFARAFGQLHHLAALGLPVAAERARLPLFDRLFTHFERQEDLANLAGKLEDDLIRAHRIVAAATSSSVVIMNEIFTSTTLQDAVRLGERILRLLIERGVLGVYVTFIDELTTLGPETVSMVAEVDPADVTSRTFHVVRRPADGLAHATALADRYGLSLDRIKERIAS